MDDEQSFETFKEMLDKWGDCNLRQFQHAMGYSNMIMVVGYAGLIGVLNAIHEDLTKTELFWSALLLLISVVIFITYEIVKMLHIRQVLANRCNVVFMLRGQLLKLKHQKWKRLYKYFVVCDEWERKWDPTFQIFWLFTFIPTVLTGYGSAAIMAIAIMGNLA